MAVNKRITEFESWQSFTVFARSIKSKSRHILDRSARKFLRAVIQGASQRERKLLKGSALWRAQIGHGWTQFPQDGVECQIPSPLESERMTPLADSAREGRVNPKGIPCFYLATDKETAMSEVRPWVGMYVSVGQFKILKNLVLIDCTSEKSDGFTFYFEEPSAAEIEKAVWTSIDRAFSEPINPNDAIADYAPTQVLSEAIKNKGYDGLIYKSVLGPGYNIALFDLKKAAIENCRLFRAKRLSFEFEEMANPYFVKKQYKRPRASLKKLG